MRRSSVSAVGFLLSMQLAACGDAAHDFRILPCIGEAPASCRVDEIEIDGQQRTYLVAGAGDADCADGPKPLVLAWHGRGSNGAMLRSYAGLDRAIAGEALVVYPDALVREDSDGLTGWNRDPDGNDIQFFDGMLEALTRDPCVDATRVFSVGHSNGGRFVEVLACHRGRAHRAAASLAAATWNVRECPESLPLWISHGRNDGTVGFWQGKAFRNRWAKRNGCDPIAWFAHFADDRCTSLPGCAAGRPVSWCPHSGTRWDGHALPPFAAREIWEFFSAQLF